MGKRRKITLDLVIDEFYKDGYILVSNFYKTNKTRLRYVCDKGHINVTNWSRHNAGHRCPSCRGLKKHTHEFIQSKFEEKGCLLISRSYVNAVTKMKYMCPRGHIGYIKWCDFNAGYGCSACSGTRKKTLDVVRKEFYEYGYVLLSTVYKNNKQKLLVKCPAGHEIYIRSDSFIRGNRCSVCARNSGVSKASQKWLDSLGVPQKNREVWLSELGIRVDGFDPETNTVYEFLGDYWHGNPNVYSPGEINRSIKKSFGQLFDETVERLFLLWRSGYNLNVIWEEDFSNV